jgi:hypothetical protein
MPTTADYLKLAREHVARIYKALDGLTMIKALEQAIRCWPSHEAELWVRQFLSQACNDPRVLAVVAFGSAARSSDYSADVDLLVVYEEAKPFLAGHPLEVDIRWYERADAERMIAAGHELLGWIVKFGQPICEQNGYWTRLHNTWSDRVPFPSASVASGRAERADHLYADLLRIGDVDAAQEQFLVALTERARATLIREHIFPASRPELPGQLRKIGDLTLAASLEEALKEREQV